MEPDRKSAKRSAFFFWFTVGDGEESLSQNAESGGIIWHRCGFRRGEKKGQGAAIFVTSEETFIYKEGENRALGLGETGKVPR